MRPTTLCFPIDSRNHILLGRKKRGFGAGKWNGFGGKLERGETFRACAVRECKEEAGLLIKETELQPVAFLDFRFSAEPSLDHIGYVYFASLYTGTPRASEEMEPQWFSYDRIPFESMWAGDRIWLPRLLQGEKLSGSILFDRDNEHVAEMKLKAVETVIEI